MQCIGFISAYYCFYHLEKIEKMNICNIRKICCLPQQLKPEKQEESSWQLGTQKTLCENWSLVSSISFWANLKLQRNQDQKKELLSDDDYFPSFWQHAQSRGSFPNQEEDIVPVPKHMSVKRQGREEEGWSYSIESNLGNASHATDELQLVESDSNFSGGEGNQIHSCLVNECGSAKCFCECVFILGCYFFFPHVNF